MTGSNISSLSRRAALRLFAGGASVAILATLSDGFTKPNPDLYQTGLQARQALLEGSPG